MALGNTIEMEDCINKKIYLALGNTIEMEDCINKKIYFYLRIPDLGVICFLT